MTQLLEAVSTILFVGFTHSAWSSNLHQAEMTQSLEAVSTVLFVGSALT